MSIIRKSLKGVNFGKYEKITLLRISPLKDRYEWNLALKHELKTGKKTSLCDNPCDFYFIQIDNKAIIPKEFIRLFSDVENLKKLKDLANTSVDFEHEKTHKKMIDKIYKKLPESAKLMYEVI